MIEIYFAYFIVLVLGFVLGSYLNSWMWRVKEEKWLLFGRSMCVHCSRTLAWYENIPLFSYIFLKGRCRTCGEKIPISYFLVELFTGIIFVLVAALGVSRGSIPAEIFRNLFFSALLIVVFVYDAKYQLILPSVIWLGVVVGSYLNFKYLGIDIYTMLVGALIGGGFFYAQYLVSGGRWIGGGDVRLGVMMGVWLGWQGVLVALLVAYCSGAVVGIILLVLKKKQRNSEIPFGTFLSVATFAAIFWGESILRWYLNRLN